MKTIQKIRNFLLRDMFSIKFSTIDLIILIILFLEFKWYIVFIIIIILLNIQTAWKLYKKFGIPNGSSPGKWYIDFSSNAPIVESDREQILKNVNDLVDSAISKTKTNGQ